MTIIAIKKMSAGDGVIGNMWSETKIFTPETTLKEIMEWNENCTTRNIILSIADE